jgi:hypothetical protein
MVGQDRENPGRVTQNHVRWHSRGIVDDLSIPYRTHLGLYR